MTQRFYSLILFGPHSPRVFKMHLSRRTAKVVMATVLISFIAAAWAGLTFPGTVSEASRAHLQAENQELQTEASNAQVGIQLLETKLSELEKISTRINELVDNRHAD